MSNLDRSNVCVKLIEIHFDFFGTGISFILVSIFYYYLILMEWFTSVSSRSSNMFSRFFHKSNGTAQANGTKIMEEKEIQ